MNVYDEILIKKCVHLIKLEEQEARGKLFQRKFGKEPGLKLEKLVLLSLRHFFLLRYCYYFF